MCKVAGSPPKAVASKAGALLGKVAKMQNAPYRLISVGPRVERRAVVFSSGTLGLNVVVAVV